MPSKLPQRAALSAPAVVTEPAPDPFQVEPAHHRWLLTTCVAGIAGSLVIGSAVLGIFGENAAPRDAYASVEKASISGLYPKSAETGRSLIGRKEFSATYQPQADDAERSVVPERDLNNANLYPEITSGDLPYNEDRPVVIDADIDGVEDEENITTITKQVPPEPTDETFKLAKGQSLIDVLTDRGVSQEAAKALVASINPIFPVNMIKPGTTFELTLDRQIAVDLDLSEQFARRIARERRLDEPVRGRALGVEELREAVEELNAAGLRDVEQDDAHAVERDGP